MPKKPELRVKLEEKHVQDLEMLKKYFSIRKRTTVVLFCISTVANQIRNAGEQSAPV